MHETSELQREIRARLLDELGVAVVAIADRAAADIAEDVEHRRRVELRSARSRRGAGDADSR